MGPRNCVLDVFEVLPHGKGQFWDCPTIEKHWESLLQCTQHKRSFSPQ